MHDNVQQTSHSSLEMYLVNNLCTTTIWNMDILKKIIYTTSPSKYKTTNTNTERCYAIFRMMAFGLKMRLHLASVVQQFNLIRHHTTPK